MPGTGLLMYDIARIASLRGCGMECVRTKDLLELKRTFVLVSCIDGGLSYMPLVKGASEGSFDALQH